LNRGRQTFHVWQLLSGSGELRQLRLLKRASSPDLACSLCVPLESHYDVPFHYAREKKGNPTISDLVVGEERLCSKLAWISSLNRSTLWTQSGQHPGLIGMEQAADPRRRPTDQCREAFVPLVYFVVKRFVFWSFFFWREINLQNINLLGPPWPVFLNHL